MLGSRHKAGIAVVLGVHLLQRTGTKSAPMREQLGHIHWLTPKSGMEYPGSRKELKINCWQPLMRLWLKTSHWPREVRETHPCRQQISQTPDGSVTEYSQYDWKKQESPDAYQRPGLKAIIKSLGREGWNRKGKKKAKPNQKPSTENELTNETRKYTQKLNDEKQPTKANNWNITSFRD